LGQAGTPDAQVALQYFALLVLIESGFALGVLMIGIDVMSRRAALC
jgi:hypothetical protein